MPTQKPKPFAVNKLIEEGFFAGYQMGERDAKLKKYGYWESWVEYKARLELEYDIELFKYEEKMNPLKNSSSSKKD